SERKTGEPHRSPAPPRPAQRPGGAQNRPAETAARATLLPRTPGPERPRRRRARRPAQRPATGRRRAHPPQQALPCPCFPFWVRAPARPDSVRNPSPFTPAVLDADTGAGVPWMATEYVPGPTLKEAVRDHGPLPAQSLPVLASGLARALA